MTVCYYHITYTFQSESTLHSCLNVKEFLAQQDSNPGGCEFETRYCHIKVNLSYVYYLS